jgi:hypothetical protein
VLRDITVLIKAFFFKVHHPLSYPACEDGVIHAFSSMDGEEKSD